MLGSSLLIILLCAVQGVPVCEWGKYGHNCDRLCSDHCRLHPVRNLRHCQKDTGKCSEGCVRGRHGDQCDQLCSPNCISTICNQGNGGCTLGCIEGYIGYFCNITTGTQTQTTVSTVQGVPVCAWGKYGHNCDRLCSDHCGLYQGRNLRPCHKDTGKCLQGCVRGRHGDHCDQLCSPNCIKTTCNQANGGCTIGCREGYIGYFCNITTVSTVQGVPVCAWGKYGHNCDRLCSDHCGLHLGRNLRPCHKDTGKCSEGCVRGRHGDQCDQLCSPNCISTKCNQPNGGCTLGCIDGYIGQFCNRTTGSQIQTTVSALQGVPVCEWGKYGHNCDRLCSDHCRLHPVRNLRPCQKDTGKCSEGCVRGQHGDQCDQLCSPNCIKNSCIQLNGGCTIGCIEGYSGYFCNITTVSAVQGVPVCEWGKYGHNCDRLCSDHCRLHPVRNLRHCQKDTGKCSEGCVRGRHGDHCDQLCSPNCINNSCIQLNGGCTIGCINGSSGYFCNISTGSQIQTTVSAVQGVTVCEWGKYGHNCDQLCSPNCMGTKCNQPNGECTLGCIDGYTGQFCNRTTGSQIQTTGEGHINLSMQLMWILLVFFIFSTICCWKSAGCRRRFDKWFTRLIRSARCIRTLVEWFTRLIRRNPRPSSSDPSQLPLVTTQDSDRRASSDPSQDHSQSEKDPLLSTASHATPSQADYDLYYASVAGDLEEVKRLLSTPGVNINSRLVRSRTPVMEAAYRGHREVVELLVKEGANVSLVDTFGNNTLHCACMRGDVETVKYFVLSLHVVEIDARNKSGRTAAIMARLWRHQPVVDLLVSRGAQ
ncbi:multiple epidermal growth factor-like domains protein 10 [Haliotis cracherodii]|uniref:multiple epidermal growth factor-like domains protein 10 n=1 Tax=Haliotis cracherodii TaxID=6455 RepID=UPI0039EA8EC5